MLQEKKEKKKEGCTMKIDNFEKEEENNIHDKI